MSVDPTYEEALLALFQEVRDVLTCHRCGNSLFKLDGKDQSGRRRLECDFPTCKARCALHSLVQEMRDLAPTGLPVPLSAPPPLPTATSRRKRASDQAELSFILPP